MCVYIYKPKKRRTKKSGQVSIKFRIIILENFLNNFKLFN